MNYMKPVELPRPISPEEAAVLRRTLEACPVVPISGALRDSVSNVQVVSQCSCGCDMVSFDPTLSESPIDAVTFDFTAGSSPRIVAEAIGVTPEGQETGLIVWARGDRLVFLEVYGSDYSNRPARLPTPDSIRNK